MLSSTLLYTVWLDDYFLIYKDQVEFSYLVGSIKFYTSLILIFFLIAQANYMIKLNLNIERKKLQLDLGIFFGSLLIFKILIFYYISIPLMEVRNKTNYHGGIKAQNTIINAVNIYIHHGISIEYYDENKTQQKYQPSLDYIQLKEQYEIMEKNNSLFMNNFHKAPLNLGIAFLTIIGALYFGSILAKRKLANPYNKS